MVDDLVDLPLYEVFIDRRIVGVLHWEVPRSGRVRDDPTLHADDPWVGPTVGCRMVRDRAD
eukprot:68796-Heterocapsa_arctica.AAC.1